MQRFAIAGAPTIAPPDAEEARNGARTYGSLTSPRYPMAMKPLAFVLLLLGVGDLIVDRGAIIIAIGHHLALFASGFSDAVAGSIFGA